MKIKKSQLKKVIQEELSAVLGEAAGMWDTPPPPNPTPQRSGGGMPPKHSPAKLGDEIAKSYAWGGKAGGYGPGPYGDFKNAAWNRDVSWKGDEDGKLWGTWNKNSSTFVPNDTFAYNLGQGGGLDAHHPGTDTGKGPSGRNRVGTWYEKDWSEQAGDMLDATSTNSDDPWRDIEQAPYAKPVEGPITMPKRKGPPSRRSDPSAGKNTVPYLEEQLKQIIIQELAVVLLEKEDPIEPAEIPNYIAGLKSQAAGGEVSAGIAMSTLQAIVAMAAENPQFGPAAAMAAQALESIPKEAEKAAKDAMKV